jgi:hypothetical protein
MTVDLRIEQSRSCNRDAILAWQKLLVFGVKTTQKSEYVRQLRERHTTKFIKTREEPLTFADGFRLIFTNMNICWHLSRADVLFAERISPE